MKIKVICGLVIILLAFPFFAIKIYGKWMIYGYGWIPGYSWYLAKNIRSSAISDYTDAISESDNSRKEIVFESAIGKLSVSRDMLMIQMKMFPNREYLEHDYIETQKILITTGKQLTR